MREDFLEDPRFDDAAVDFTMVQLCKVLGVDPESVNWDAATETFTGDVQAVIGNILRAKFGDDDEREWFRKDCSFCGSPEGQYSPSNGNPTAAFYCKGCGINAPQKTPRSPQGMAHD
jgi:hypothetical protein